MPMLRFVSFIILANFHVTCLSVFFYERCTGKVTNCLLNFIFADKPLTLRHKLQGKSFICARLKNSLQCCVERREIATRFYDFCHMFPDVFWPWQGELQCKRCYPFLSRKRLCETNCKKKMQIATVTATDIDFAFFVVL